jgi:hypothetical protein
MISKFKSKTLFPHFEPFWPHCKSGSHKNGIRKSSRKTYYQIMGIYRFEADTVIIKKEIIISFFK